MTPIQHAKVLEARINTCIPALNVTSGCTEHDQAVINHAREVLKECAEAISIMRSAKPVPLGPGISRDDTVHGETYYTRKQVEEALRAVQVGWQPIETCPLDTMVIFGPTKRMSGPCMGMHHSRDGWVTETPSEWASIYPPKVWMPIDLPAAPSTEPEVKP